MEICIHRACYSFVGNMLQISCRHDTLSLKNYTSLSDLTYGTYTAFSHLLYCVPCKQQQQRVFSPISGADFMAQLSWGEELYYASPIVPIACPMVNGNITSTPTLLGCSQIPLHLSAWQVSEMGTKYHFKIRTDMEETVCYRT